MKAIVGILAVLGVAMAESSCAHQPPPTTTSGKKLKLETIDRGPMRPKTYLYREVNE